MSTTTATQKPTATKKIDATQIAAGDVFSEMSHYTHLKRKGNKAHVLMHHGSQTEVELGNDYIEKFLQTANQHQTEVEVGKEDKCWTEKQIKEAVTAKEFTVENCPKPGDVKVPGIRTIWENIHSSHVLQVCYQKQGKELSTKKLKELRDAQINVALEAISKAKVGKTGVASTAETEIRKIQENPIIPYEQGEMRELTGYKVQFTSRDGRYDCVDMKIPAGENAIRPVNINTIAWLIIDGVKYVVK